MISAPAPFSLSSQPLTLSFRSTRRTPHVFGQPFIFRANHSRDEGDRALAGDRRADRSPREPGQNRSRPAATAFSRPQATRGNDEHRHRLRDRDSARLVRGRDEVVAAFGRSSQGIEFDALDNAPVKFVVLFIVPKNQFQTHLRTLASIAKFLNDRSVRESLAAAGTKKRFWPSSRSARRSRRPVTARASPHPSSRSGEARGISQLQPALSRYAGPCVAKERSLSVLRRIGMTALDRCLTFDLRHGNISVAS